MSAGQESGSPIRENRTLLPAPLPPDEARGTLAAAAGVSTVGLRPPFDTPQRHSHPVCRAILTLIVALDIWGYGGARSPETLNAYGICHALDEAFAELADDAFSLHIWASTTGFLRFIKEH